MQSQRRNRLIGAGLLVVLVGAMLFSTKFLSPDALAKVGPKKFDPKQTAADLFGKAQSELPGKARPLSEVLPAIQADVKGAASKYSASSPTAGSYDFAVMATGTVKASDNGFLELIVPGIPSVTPVLVPTTTAINGSVLRDALGFKFADAPGQTEYQFVGDELKKLIQTKVISGLGSPAELKGKTVSVVGVLSVVATAGSNTVPSAKPANVQPVKIDAK